MTLERCNLLFRSSCTAMMASNVVDEVAAPCACASVRLFRRASSTALKTLHGIEDAFPALDRIVPVFVVRILLVVLRHVLLAKQT